jgi:hypothetical protein
MARMPKRRAGTVVAAIAMAAMMTGCIAPRNPSRYGVNGDGNSTAASRMKEAGFKWVRFFVGWDSMEPTGPTLDAGALNGLDASVNVYAKKGFSVDIVFTRDVPVWARDTTQAQPCADHPKARRPKVGAFGGFAGAMATHFKDRVAAWEVFNEPELDCRFPGGPGDFRRLILSEGYDAIHAAQNDAIILGPALASPGQLSDWYTYETNGHHYLTRPVAAMSVHHYGTVDDVKNAMNTANNYVACSEYGSYCLVDYWLTEFGFTESQAADSATKIFAHCESQKYCKRVFYFAANYETLSGMKVALLDPSTLAPRAKYYKVKDYILAREPALP